MSCFFTVLTVTRCHEKPLARVLDPKDMPDNWSFTRILLDSKERLIHLSLLVI